MDVRNESNIFITDGLFLFGVCVNMALIVLVIFMNYFVNGPDKWWFDDYLMEKKTFMNDIYPLIGYTLAPSKKYWGRKISQKPSKYLYRGIF